MNLIIPMAGKSSRFPDLKPKWMLTHPSGKFMAIEAISGLNIDDFDQIYFTCLEEHEEKHKFSKGFNDELELLNLHNKSTILYLKSETRHQPETVARTIEHYNIKGPILIKDSDNYFESTYRGNNSIFYYDLNKSGFIKPKNKSYIEMDENGFVNNIIEKNVISPFFCVGGYGFERAEDFTRALSEIDQSKEVFISNVIFQLILENQKFEGSLIDNYKDWGTLEDWDRYKKSYATLFLDLDGTLVKNSSVHFPPYVGNTEPLVDNINVIRNLHATGKFQIIITTSRPEKVRQETIEQLKREGIPYDYLIMGLLHSKRIIINDYCKSNPFKSCDSINLKRDGQELREILKESLGVEYEEI